ncbi:MAG: cupin-like domain-containing protein [Caulobacteraceae bacterium]
MPPPEPIREVGDARYSAADGLLQAAALACAPVVLRGFVADWPVVQAARQSPQAFRTYLAGFENDQVVEAFFGPPDIAGKYFYGDRDDGFNFERRRMRFSDALDSILAAQGKPGAPSVYVGSVPAEACLPGLGAQNPMTALDRSVMPRIWLGTASNVSCHYDTLDNLACVIAGRRRFTLYPPDAIGDLYVGPIDVTMAGQPVSLAASAPTGATDYPRFDAVLGRALVVELDPGDALYLPKLWWHQVEATGAMNGLVNYWWDGFSAGPDAPYAALLLTMIAIAERPAPERQAWKAFFDHYAFRSAGHPLAHLPAERHGILGPLKPSNYGRIRARVMQMLRG